MPPPSGYRAVGRLAGERSILWHSDREYLVAPDPDLTLLLPTSGSTGAPKYVRLSSANLASNAGSIAEFLQLGPGEIAVQSLPFYYAYGLSILNSHLISGGAVAIIQRNFMDPDYWRSVADFGCTSFAGVPYMYEVLRRLDLAPTDIPTLRMITQAGGHLPENLARHFHARARSGGKSFVIMYGQTEATARIAYVPSDRLEEKFGTVGIPIPRGSLTLVPAGPDLRAQQLRYRGPNVMMGYAGAPADLARGDDLGGILDTGDLAEVDPDGFFRIVGRIARFAKLFGKRINLQELEREVGARFKQPVAMTEADGRLRVFVEGADLAMDIEMHLIQELQVPNFAVKASVVSSLPRTAAGKIDYKMLPP
jgi:acyl-CoA synthetase (AMP-forming)/AMP-acid ligase II